MTRNLYIILPGIVLAAFGSESFAQPFGGPMRRGPGIESQQITNLVARDIGIGYSVDSLNANTLAGLQVRAAGVGGGFNRGRTATAAAAAGFRPSTRRAPQKPFSDISRRPTVSPYLNLFREDFSGESDLNYQTLVRPQLQQQAVNDQVQRQTQVLNRQLQQVAAQPSLNPQGSQLIMPTGHAATFGFTGRFYPVPQR